MKVKWLGHAAFLITSEGGTRIVTDPYQAGFMGVDYGPIEEAADIVLVSHDHPDHNHVAGVPGNPEVVKGAGRHQVKGIEFKGVDSFHDDTGGSQRGPNTIFCFSVDGVRVCHLGDLGHTLSEEQLSDIGEVDVLLTPMAGTFTIDPAQADQVVGQTKPRVVIPMHYKTEKCPNFPVSDVDPFISGKTNVKSMDASEVEFRKDQLPSATQVIVLKPAC